MNEETCDKEMLDNYDFSDGVRGKYIDRLTTSVLHRDRATPRSTEFELRARSVLSRYYAVELSRGNVPPVRKQFDFVSPDGHIVGNAKYYSLVGGSGRPPAKLATISEYVWLLEKTGAPETFLVFGHDLKVPELWLKDYGNLLNSVKFYFLDDDDRLQQLAGLSVAKR
jgi:hypothetical protein